MEIKKQYWIYLAIAVGLFAWVMMRSKNKKQLQKTGGCGCQGKKPPPVNPNYKDNGKLNPSDAEVDKDIESVYEKRA